MPAVLVVISMICTVITFIPMPWHWRSKNIPTVMLMIWIGQGNFFRGISAALWNGSVVRKDLVFCDITLALEMASVWGMTACALCTTRHLESISSPRYSSSGLSDPRKRKYFEVFMCIIAPFIFAAIHLIVQGHRFDLIEDIGCSPSTYWSWASLFLFYLPPLVLSIITMIYAAMALRWFLQRRAQFQDLLSSSGMSGSRYLRLMGLAITEMFGSAALNAYVIYDNAQYPLRPWISWQNVHSDFYRVNQWPLVYYTPKQQSNLWGIWSLYAISAVVFFAFFGFGQEAMVEYKRSYVWVKTCIFRIPHASPSESKVAELPSFVARSSMASVRKAHLPSDFSTSKGSSSPTSMTASEKCDAALDLDDDSLYDADERRGRCDLEAGVETMDEKSFTTSYNSYNPPHHAKRSQSPAPPLPPLVTRPEPAVTHNHRVSLSRSTSSDDSGSITEIPSAL